MNYDGEDSWFRLDLSKAMVYLTFAHEIKLKSEWRKIIRTWLYLIWVENIYFFEIF